MGLLLKKSTYGTQDASHIWQKDYVTLMCSVQGSFARGRHNAALFVSYHWDVRVLAHGDDFVCLGDRPGLQHVVVLLKSKYSAKDLGTLRFEIEDDKKSMC